MKTDYDKNSKIIPTAKPKLIPVMDLKDLDKKIVIDPTSFGELKAYINQLKMP